MAPTCAGSDNSFTLRTSAPRCRCYTLITLYPPLFISPSKRLSSSLVSLIASYYPILSPPPPLLFSPCPLLVWKRQLLALTPLLCRPSLSLYLFPLGSFRCQPNLSRRSAAEVAASTSGPFHGLPPLLFISTTHTWTGAGYFM